MADMTADENIRAGNRRAIIATTCALLVTLVLFYADEGYYNCKWMSEPGNWIPFLFYTASILGIQVIISELILGKCSARIKMTAIPVTAFAVLAATILAFSK